MWNNLKADKKLLKPAQASANKENVVPTEDQSFYTVLTSELKIISAKLSGKPSYSLFRNGPQSQGPKTLDRAEQLYQEILLIDQDTGKSLRYVKIILDLLSSGTVKEFIEVIVKKKSKW